MKKTTKATLAGLLGYSIFGFSFIACKIGYDIAEPTVLLCIRFIIAFLLMNLMLLFGMAKLNLKGKPVGKLVLLGLIEPVAYFFFESYGIAMTTAAFSGVIIGLLPVVGLVFGMLFLKEHCTLVQAIFTCLSVAGVAMTTTGGFGSVSVPGFLLLLGAVVSAASFTILSRSISEDFSPFERTYMMFALASIVFTVTALIRHRADLSVFPAAMAEPAFWGATIYLATLSSVGAFMMVNYALSHISAGRLLIFSNFTTVISVLGGIFIMGDSFSPMQLLGIAIITLSVFGVTWQKTENTENLTQN